MAQALLPPLLQAQVFSLSPLKMEMLRQRLANHLSHIGTQTSKPAASSKLSGGAIGGIAIGAVAVVALIAVGAFFLGRKYMQGQKNTAATINPDYAPVYPGYWQGGGYTDAGQKPQMQQPTELDAPEEMHELPSAARHELS